MACQPDNRRGPVSSIQHPGAGIPAGYFPPLTEGEGDALGGALSVSPNPFSGHTIFKFDLPESCPATLRIFDLAGRAVFEKSVAAGAQSLDFQGSLLPGRGVYLARLAAADGRFWVKKLVVE